MFIPWLYSRFDARVLSDAELDGPDRFKRAVITGLRHSYTMMKFEYRMSIYFV